MKKIVVTGGGGFLGFAVIKALKKKNPQSRIYSLSRNYYNKLEDLKVEQIKADIGNESEIKESYFEDIDLVFHIAAKPGVWGNYENYYKINFLGTKHIADICLKKNIPMIHTSSPSVVFSGIDMEGVNESVPYPKKFSSHYSKTKALAEQYVLKLCEKGLKSIILRPHLIWGPFDNHLVPKILKKSKKLFKIGSKKNLVDTIYIDNAAYAHILAGEKLIEKKDTLSGKIYFLSQDEPIYVFDMIDNILNAGGLKKIEKTIPYFLGYAVAFLLEAIFIIFRIKKEPVITRFVVKELATSHWFDISNAKKDLNYTPTVSTKNGLKILKEHLLKISNN